MHSIRRVLSSVCAAAIAFSAMAVPATATERMYSPYASGYFTASAQSTAEVCHGIDVSSHQGTIDWEKVAADGITFAIIRAECRGYKTGKIVEDSTALYNLKEAQRAGLKVGVYCFDQAITAEEAAEEADTLVDFLETNDIQVDFPIVMDQEFGELSGQSTGRLYEAYNSSGTFFMTEIADAFVTEAHARGYNAMLYSSLSNLNGMIYTDMLYDCSYWLAHYNTTTGYSGEYSIWQYAAGTVDGISTDADLDFGFDISSLSPWYVDTADETAPASIKFMMTEFPSGTLTRGAACSLEGMITSTRTLTTVTGTITSATGEVVQEVCVNPGSRNFSLSNSIINSGLRFGQLDSGSYRLTYTAAADDGTQATWGVQFKVSQVSGTVPDTPVSVPTHAADESGETEPAESEPAETEPAESEPAESEPAESEPAETEPAESQPAGTEPAESEPAESEPAETEPAESEPAETEPAESEPTESEPAESEPAEPLSITVTNAPAGAYASADELYGFEVTGMVEGKPVYIHAAIMTADDRVAQESSDECVGEVYSLKCSTVSIGLAFDELEDGWYYLSVDAADSSGSTIQWKSTIFAVGRQLFNDVTTKNWYYYPAYYMASAGFVSGSLNKDGTISFLGDQDLSWAEAITLAYRVAGSPETDLSCLNGSGLEKKWYAPYLAWAYSNQLLVGVDSLSDFSANAPLTRQDFLYLLWRSCGSPDADLTVLENYVDSAKISDYATTAVAWAVSCHYIESTSVSRLEASPLQNLTRAEAIQMEKNEYESNLAS